MYKFYSVHDFMRKVKREGVDFPLKKLYKTDDDIRAMMEKLKAVDYRDRIEFGVDYKVLSLSLPLKYCGESTLLVNEHSDYSDFNTLSDMFVEDVRMEATVYGWRDSPASFFRKYPAKVAKEALKKGPITPRTLSDAMYDMKSVKECTSFRPNIMVQIIQICFPHKKRGEIHVLDPSSGWGDRLIAAIAAGVKYTGVDPNPRMAPRYADIMKFFGARHTMVESPFEDVKLQQEYDLVFTSPPYFDLETYDDADVQSIKRFPGVDGWTKGFLLPYVEKAWNALKPGGFMAINIGQRHDQTYVEQMVEYINGIGAEYLGIISHAARDRYKKAQPIFIWRKYAPLHLEINGLTIRDATPADEALLEKSTKKFKPAPVVKGDCALASVHDTGKCVGFIGYAPVNYPTLENRSVMRVHVLSKWKGQYEKKIIDSSPFNYRLLASVSRVGGTGEKLFSGKRRHITIGKRDFVVFDA